LLSGKNSGSRAALAMIAATVLTWVWSLSTSIASRVSLGVSMRLRSSLGVKMVTASLPLATTASASKPTGRGTKFFQVFFAGVMALMWGQVASLIDLRKMRVAYSVNFFAYGARRFFR